MFKRPTPLSTRSLNTSMTARKLVGLSVMLISLLMCGLVNANPIKVDLEEDGEGLHYRISTSSASGRVSASDIKLSLTDDKEPLHSIEIQNVSAKKKWLKSFTESKSHPYIKGILVRERSGGSVQVRTRFKASPRLPKNYASTVSISEEGSGVVVTLVSPIKAAAARTSVAVETPKPDRKAESEQLKQEVQKIRHMTAKLQEKPSAADAQTTPSKTSGEGSPFERGVRPPPTPSLGASTPTSDPSLKPSTPQPPQALSAPLPMKPATGDAGLGLTAPALTPPPPPSPLAERKTDVKRVEPLKPIEPPAAPSAPSDEGLGGLNLNLDRQIGIVSVLFVVALVGLVLMRRSGKSGTGAGEIPFKIRSRQLVNAQWNQEILIVDVLDRTLLLGSSASGGLSLLAQISPDPHAQPAPQPRYQDYQAYPESDDYPAERYEQGYGDERYQDEPSFHEGYEVGEYYPEQRNTPRVDVGHHPQQHEPALDEGDSSYTLEVPMSEMDAIPAQVTADLTAERAVPMGGFNASTALGGLEALVSEAQSRSSSSASRPSEPEPSSVSADDLLQKIRQLNQG